MLKIHKAKYGTKVFLNGHVVGEHLPCFTPALLDVKPHLKGDGQRNELIVRVGAERDLLPKDMVTGSDFEKCRYLPGIYDSVELILTGTPTSITCRPFPTCRARQVRVAAEIRAGDEQGDFSIDVTVAEAKSGKAAVLPAEGRQSIWPAGGRQVLNVTVPMGDCHLWSPEDPFLYELTVSTGSDAVKTRFGMRSFRCDPQTRRVLLNEKPYFMRGTNVCIFRFFEDAHRGNLPWQTDWVRRLHQKYKSMHWNSIRYCIGFPPEIWYDVADEEGFLIQDEFPIWIGDATQARAAGRRSADG